MSGGCLGFFFKKKDATVARLLRDCFPKGVGASDDKVALANSKVGRLVEYAIQFPQHIATIGEDVGAALQQHYRAKQYGMVEAYVTILKALVSKCAEGNVLALLQPHVIHALMLLLRSSHVRVVGAAAALFFEYTDRLNSSGGSGDNLVHYLAPILDLCDRPDTDVMHSEHEALDDDKMAEPLVGVGLLGYQMLQRVLAAMVAAPGAAPLETHLPKIVPCVWRAIVGDLREASAARRVGWDCLALLATVASPGALTHVFAALLEVFERSEWQHVDTIVEAFTTISDAAARATLHPAPVVRVLLTYAETLVAPEISVAPDGRKGGLFGRLARVFAEKKERHQSAKLLRWVAGALTVVELYMSQQADEAGVATAERRAAVPAHAAAAPHSVDEDLTRLLAVQLFLCVVARHDYRIADTDLPLPSTGDRPPAPAYATLAEAGAAAMLHPTGDRSRIAADVRAQAHREPRDFSSTVERTVDSLRPIKEVTDDAVKAVYKLVWRCVALVSKRHMPVGRARADVLPGVLRYLEVAENRVRSLCERVAEGGGRVDMDRESLEDAGLGYMAAAGAGAAAEDDADDDHAARLTQGRDGDMVSVDEHARAGAATAAPGSHGEARPRAAGAAASRLPSAVATLQRICANVVTTLRVYVLYTANILLTASAELSGPALSADGVQPLTAEAVCHLCLLAQAGEPSVTRQAVCVFLHLLRGPTPSNTAAAAIAATVGGGGNPWAPLTAVQVTLVRDVIFSVLCACPSRPVLALSALAAWALQVALLRTYGAAEVISGLPQLLTLEDYWTALQDAGPGDSDGDGEATADILCTQRLFFATYLLQVARQFDAPGVRKIAETLLKQWGDAGALPAALNAVPPPTPSTLASFVGAEYGSAAAARADVDLVLRPPGLLAEPRRLGVAVAAVNRADLLAALVAGTGLRAEAAAVKAAFAVRYVPRDDPYVRLEELAAAGAGAAAANDPADSPVRLSRSALSAHRAAASSSAAATPSLGPRSRRGRSPSSNRSHSRSAGSRRSAAANRRARAAANNAAFVPDLAPTLRPPSYAEKYQAVSAVGDAGGGGGGGGGGWLGQRGAGANPVQALLAVLDDLGLPRIGRQ